MKELLLSLFKEEISDDDDLCEKMSCLLYSFEVSMGSDLIDGVDCCCFPEFILPDDKGVCVVELVVELAELLLGMLRLVSLTLFFLLSSKLLLLEGDGNKDVFGRLFVVAFLFDELLSGVSGSFWNSGRCICKWLKPFLEILIGEIPNGSENICDWLLVCIVFVSLKFNIGGRS